MEVKLVMASGKTAGQEISVVGPRFFIGRAEDCHLRPRSDLVSRHHCVLLVEAGMVALRDFGSKNGTYVNGERISGEVELKSGDRLRVGTIDFEIRLGVELKAKKKPKVHSVQEAAARTAQSGGSSQEQEDMDVTSWLDEEEAGALGNTATMGPGRRNDTIPMKAPEPQAEEPEEPEEPAAPSAHRTSPNAFQSSSNSGKPSSGSTQDAAANMLKNLFRR